MKIEKNGDLYVQKTLGKDEVLAERTQFVRERIKIDYSAKSKGKFNKFKDKNPYESLETLQRYLPGGDRYFVTESDLLEFIAETDMQAIGPNGRTILKTGEIGFVDAHSVNVFTDKISAINFNPKFEQIESKSYVYPIIPSRPKPVSFDRFVVDAVACGQINALEVLRNFRESSEFAIGSVRDFKDPWILVRGKFTNKEGNKIDLSDNLGSKVKILKSNVQENPYVFENEISEIIEIVFINDEENESDSICIPQELLRRQSVITELPKFSVSNAFESMILPHLGRNYDIQSLFYDIVNGDFEMNEGKVTQEGVWQIKELAAKLDALIVEYPKHLSLGKEIKHERMRKLISAKGTSRMADSLPDAFEAVKMALDNGFFDKPVPEEAPKVPKPYNSDFANRIKKKVNSLYKKAFKHKLEDFRLKTDESKREKLPVSPSTGVEVNKMINNDVTTPKVNRRNTNVNSSIPESHESMATKYTHAAENMNNRLTRYIKERDRDEVGFIKHRIIGQECSTTFFSRDGFVHGINEIPEYISRERVNEICSIEARTRFNLSNGTINTDPYGGITPENVYADFNLSLLAWDTLREKFNQAPPIKSLNPKCELNWPFLKWLATEIYIPTLRELELLKTEINGEREYFHEFVQRMPSLENLGNTGLRFFEAKKIFQELLERFEYEDSIIRSEIYKRTEKKSKFLDAGGLISFLKSLLDGNPGYGWQDVLYELATGTLPLEDSLNFPRIGLSTLKLVAMRADTAKMKYQEIIRTKNGKPLNLDDLTGREWNKLVANGLMNVGKYFDEFDNARVGEKIWLNLLIKYADEDIRSGALNVESLLTTKSHSVLELERKDYNLPHYLSDNTLNYFSECEQKLIFKEHELNLNNRLVFFKNWLISKMAPEDLSVIGDSIQRLNIEKSRNYLSQVTAENIEKFNIFKKWSEEYLSNDWELSDDSNSKEQMESVHKLYSRKGVFCDFPIELKMKGFEKSSYIFSKTEKCKSNLQKNDEKDESNTYINTEIYKNVKINNLGIDRFLNEYYTLEDVILDITENFNGGHFNCSSGKLTEYTLMQIIVESHNHQQMAKQMELNLDVKTDCREYMNDVRISRYEKLKEQIGTESLNDRIELVLQMIEAAGQSGLFNNFDLDALVSADTEDRMERLKQSVRPAIRRVDKPEDIRIMSPQQFHRGAKITDLYRKGPFIQEEWHIRYVPSNLIALGSTYRDKLQVWDNSFDNISDMDLPKGSSDSFNFLDLLRSKCETSKIQKVSVESGSEVIDHSSYSNNEELSLTKDVDKFSRLALFELNEYENQESSSPFDHIRISIASPEMIHSWSFGEIKLSNTIDYRSFKPKKNGLYCACIFGPTKDYECLCGKYKGAKYRGIICERCEVEVIQSNVRRERMGHIELAVPVVHPWFIKSTPSTLELLLNLESHDLNSIVYYKKYVVLKPGMTHYSQGELISNEQFVKAQDIYGADSFVAMTGAEAIREMLISFDLKEESEINRQLMNENKSEQEAKIIANRLRTIESFIESGIRPEWMIISALPVTPPGLRPLIPITATSFIESPINDVYGKIIDINNRIKKLLENKQYYNFYHGEMCKLQLQVDALFDDRNFKRIYPISGYKIKKSQSERFKLHLRQSLYGKQVDFSGTANVIVSPDRKLHQCGLPKKIALELLKPFIYSRLQAKGYSKSTNQSRELVEGGSLEVLDILDEIIDEHPILISRIPPVNKLSMLAFQPILIEGNVLQLNPLAFSALNLNGDENHLAVHLPLSLEAKFETKRLLMSTKNILDPANGETIIVPSQEMELGLIYLSIEAEYEPGEGMKFANMNELHFALENKVVSLHTKIKFRFESANANGDPKFDVYETTPGRILIGEHLPKHHKIPFDVCNKELTKKEIFEMIDMVFRNCGNEATVIFCEGIAELGLEYACKAGLSVCKDNLVVPTVKQGMVAETIEFTESYKKQFKEGKITKRERNELIKDEWAMCTDRINDIMVKMVEAKEIDNLGCKRPPNSIQLKLQTGIPESKIQLKKLAGMIGLTEKIDGTISEDPIISNFKEGLNVNEFYNSASSVRKKLVDTLPDSHSLNYLSRMLVDVVEDQIISIPDCETSDGILIQAIKKGGKVIVPLGQRIIGRVASENIVNRYTGGTLVPKGKLIEEEDITKIESAGIQVVKTRSVLTCRADTGICAACYGRDLARGTPVNIGEAVGVIAGLAIGEHCKGLKLEVIHTVGSTKNDVRSFIYSNINGIVKLNNRVVRESFKGKLVVMEENMTISILDQAGTEIAECMVPYGAVLNVDDEYAVSCGDILAQWDTYRRPILAVAEGKVDFEDLKEEVNLMEIVDDKTGISEQIVIDRCDSENYEELQPAIIIRIKNKKVAKNRIAWRKGLDARQLLSPGTILSVLPGDYVTVGDVMATSEFEFDTRYEGEIVPNRITELFEAFRPRKQAIISRTSGTFRYGQFKNNIQNVFVDPRFKLKDEKEKELEVVSSFESTKYMIPNFREIKFQEGDFIEKGESITDGIPNPHDILELKGVEATMNYLVNEIQKVYRSKGIKIDDKHIEIIVGQMLQFSKIVDPGESNFSKDNIINNIDLKTLNEKLKTDGNDIIRTKPILLGITQVILQKKSVFSPSCYLESSDVLADVAVSGKSHKLEGMKENKITGRLIPAGTGIGWR